MVTTVSLVTTCHHTELLQYLTIFPMLYGEGNSNPLQCACLENPMDGEAW